MINWGEHFKASQSYDKFLDQYGSEIDQSKWADSLARVNLTDAQKQVLATFKREVKVLCLAGAWCGDCVDQCPILQAIATEQPCINLKFIDRDANDEVKSALSLCGAARVPQVVFLNEDDQFIAHFGDRTLARYRQMGQSVGGATCSTGLVGVDGDPVFDAIVQEWVNEFERVHWIVRLSPRLRTKHGD